MISRVAESCFWLSRYLERAETLARVLDVHLALYLDAGLEDLEEWRPLIIVSGEEKPFLERHGATAIENSEAVLSYLTWEPKNPVSLYSSIKYARENSRTIREAISLEMWEIVNELWLWLGSAAGRKLYDDERHEFFSHVRDQCLLFSGARWGSMLHEEPFNFMRLGTALERVGQTARILDVKYHTLGDTELGRETPLEAVQWLATLRSCMAIEPFFKRAAHELSGVAVTEFLLYDPAFPRSVYHNVQMAEHVLDLIRGEEAGGVGSRSADAFAELHAWMRSQTVEQLIAAGLHESLTWIVDSSIAACDVVDGDFFRPRAKLSQPAAKRSSLPGPS